VVIQAADALDLAVRIVSVGLSISALEHYADRHAFGRAGPFSRAVFDALRGSASPLLARPALVGPLALAKLAAACTLIATGPFSPTGRAALALLALTAMTLRWRRAIGGDGAEQLSIIIVVAALAAALPVPGEQRIVFATAFVSAQAVLAYVTAGLSKIVSPLWRNGSALPAILATSSHGQARAAAVLGAHPRIGLAMTWGVMLFEILFPLLLLGPDWLASFTLAAGVAFHLGCAVLMGLNSFLWAFPATYVCLLSTRADVLALL
jgi:hypothetical protein